MVEHFEKMGLRPFGAAPAERHMEWYRRRKTAFLHFGPNTFTDREWGDGRESAEVFAPSELDCRQWAKVLREGGFDAHHTHQALFQAAALFFRAVRRMIRTDHLKSSVRKTGP